MRTLDNRVCTSNRVGKSRRVAKKIKKELKIPSCQCAGRRRVKRYFRKCKCMCTVTSGRERRRTESKRVIEIRT